LGFTDLSPQTQAYEAQGGSDAVSPPAIDADDPALVRARHDRSAVSARAAEAALPLDLVLPIIEPGRLCGFVAVGDKPEAPANVPTKSKPWHPAPAWSVSTCSRSAPRLINWKSPG
jgi:hypothetical protein